MPDDALIWAVRAWVYAHFAERACAPDQDDIARRFAITPEQAGQILLTLHERHALFLEPGTTAIRFANPFSAIPTPFKVGVRGQTYWANCAWDCFGIVAALHAPEATIDSICAYSGAALRLTLTPGQISGPDAIVHFFVPFQHWYDDLVFT